MPTQDVKTIRTDWDTYYSKPAATARVTRQITTQYLIRALRCYEGNLQEARLLEWGGANSCFYQSLQQALNPKEYVIADSNRLGLEKFFQTHPQAQNVKTFCADVLSPDLMHLPTSDVVFSVGLIEHFAPVETARAIATHFQLVRPGGLVVLSFPTPTGLYRVTRGLLEGLRLWGFPDERPLTFDEVRREVERHGQILRESLNWSILLTQGLMVAKTPPLRA